MPGPFYFAYVDAPIAFDPVVHQVEDEAIITAKLSQDEGGFASLEIDVVNPGVGLLSTGRMQWCWFSWFDGVALKALFTGRLVGVPEALNGETVRLQFVAKPIDYEANKTFLVVSLKVPPYYDKVWITAAEDDPDAIIKPWGAQYHIDRVTHNLTISDDLVGEDGTITILENDHLYDDFELSYSQKPKLKAKFKGTLAWTQSGTGTIDLTEKIYHLFREQKSIYVGLPKGGIISTLTGDGLKGDWPTGGTSLGGGWTVNTETSIEVANTLIYAPYTYDVTYQGLSPDWSSSSTSETGGTFFFNGFTDYIVKFPVGALKQRTKFDWKAEKKRSEILEFTMEPDIQPLENDVADTEATLSITISASDTVTEPDGGGDMPIGNLNRKSYLNTDRGADSVMFAMLLCRAQLRRGARAVELKVRVPWATGIDATLRQNLLVVDRRVPGTPAGKITSYEAVADATSGFYVNLTAGCAIGTGGPSPTAPPGTSGYVTSGYVTSGYTTATGGGILGPTSEIVYETLDDFPIDDDGVDLLTLAADTAVVSFVLTGGLSEQVDAVTGNIDPINELKKWPSRLCLQLAPVAGISFETTFSPTVEKLPIPRMIDLEAIA